MGRPSKPAGLLKSEGKSHRTKQELAFRKQQEEATLTGKKLEEPRAVKDLKIAHATFLKTRRLLDAINKNESLSVRSPAGTAPIHRSLQMPRNPFRC